MSGEELWKLGGLRRSLNLKEGFPILLLRNYRADLGLVYGARGTVRALRS